MVVSEFSDVFVSYRRKNVDFAKEIVDELRKQNKEVWIDWEDIPPGSVGFTDDIQKGIEGADTFISILSPDYIESEYCLMELEHAIKMNKKLIPIVHQKFDDYPAPSGIGHINWIYFTPHAGQENTFEESFLKVMDAIDTDLEYVRKHKRLLIRALEWQENNKKNGFLLMGDELEEATYWVIEAASKQPNPTDLQLEYIEAGQGFAKRRQRMVLTGVTVALIVSIVLTITSVFFFFQAETARYLTNVRLLANRLPAISANEPFIARSVAQGMLELDNIPLVANAAAQNILLTGAAVESFEGHTDIVPDVAFVGDGGQFVSASEDGTIRLYDTTIHEAIRVFSLPDAEAGVLTVDISPDNTQMLSGDTGGAIILWDLETGDIISRFDAHTSEVNVVRFLSDGMTVASGDGAGQIYIRDIETGDIQSEFIVADDGIYDLALSPDDSIMIAGTDAGLVVVWDMETGELLKNLEGHVGEVYSVDISDDGRRAISGSADNRILMWDLVNLEQEGRPFVGHKDEVWGVTFNHAEDRILSVAGDRTLRIWEFDNRNIPITITGHSGWVNDVDIASDDEMVITGSDDNTAILWNIAISSVIEEYHPSRVRVLSMAVSSDASIVAIGIEDGSVFFLDTGTGALSNARQETESRTEAMTFLSNSNILFTGHCKNPVERPCSLGEILKWDAETQSVLDRFDAGTGLITDMSSGSNETYGTFVVASTTGDNDAILFNADTGEELQRFTGHSDAIDGVAVSPDSQRLLTASRDGLVMLWSIEDGSKIREFSGHRDWVSNVTWFSDNRHALSTSWDGTLIHWDTEATNSDSKVINVLEGHQGAVMNVAISSDDTTAISGSRDSSVIIWDIEAGEAIRTLEGHANDVIDLAWVDDGKQAYSASFDGSVRHWQVFLDDENAHIVADAHTQVDICAGIGQSEAIANQYNVPQLCGNFIERFMARFKA